MASTRRDFELWFEPSSPRNATMSKSALLIRAFTITINLSLSLFLFVCVYVCVSETVWLLCVCIFMSEHFDYFNSGFDLIFNGHINFLIRKKNSVLVDDGL